MSVNALLPLLSIVVMAFLVVLVFVLPRYRTVKQPGATVSDPGTVASWPGSTQGRWNGEILGTGGLGALGGTLGSTFGVFEVAEGRMTFTPDGSPVPDWTASCQALVVARRGFFSLNGADISLSWQEGPSESGWRTAACNVSRERINRLMDNDFKELRERGYATEFIGCLAANGARVNG